jgi:hypothetical protein
VEEGFPVKTVSINSPLGYTVLEGLEHTSYQGKPKGARLASQEGPDKKFAYL